MELRRIALAEGKRLFGVGPYSVSGNNPINFSDPLGDDYFRSKNGMGVVWRDSQEAFALVNGEFYENIGPIVGRVSGGLFHMYINNQLAYVGFAEPNGWAQAGPFLAPLTEHATPYYKGQQYFINWIKDRVQYSSIDKFRLDLFHQKLSIQASYARGIFGGVPPGTEEKIRIKTNLEMIPTLREAYLNATKSGIDLLGYRRNLTMLTNEEVSDVAVGTAVSLVPMYLGQIGMLRTMSGPYKGPMAYHQSTDDMIATMRAEQLAANSGSELLNQFNSAESLVQGAGNLTQVKAGMQGFVKGDGQAIFNAISRGGTRQANGTILMEDGTTLFSHFSTKTGIYTIDINKAGIIYKIRVTP